MAKKKRVRRPSEYSLAQLQELLDNKASELSDLRAKRAEAQKDLNELDRLIREAEGGTGKKAGFPKKRAAGADSTGAAGTRKKKKKVSRKGKRVRAKNPKSAKSYAQEILSSEPKGLPLDELANRILANGYKSNSTSFKNTLYQTLYNDRRAGKTFDYNDKTGRWVLR